MPSLCFSKKSFQDPFKECLTYYPYLKSLVKPSFLSGKDHKKTKKNMVFGIPATCFRGVVVAESIDVDPQKNQWQLLGVIYVDFFFGFLLQLSTSTSDYTP